MNAFEYKRVSKRAKHNPLYNVQWIWMPMMNPDGYAITHKKDESGEGGGHDSTYNLIMICQTFTGYTGRTVDPTLS